MASHENALHYTMHIAQGTPLHIAQYETLHSGQQHMTDTT